MTVRKIVRLFHQKPLTIGKGSFEKLDFSRGFDTFVRDRAKGSSLDVKTGPEMPVRVVRAVRNTRYNREGSVADTYKNQP